MGNASGKVPKKSSKRRSHSAGAAVPAQGTEDVADRSGDPSASGSAKPSRSPSAAIPMTSAAPIPGGKAAYVRPKGSADSSESESGEEEGELDLSHVRPGENLLEGTTEGPVGGRVTFDDFEPVKVIGCGCFGKVMMVVCKKNGKVYAMKSIRKSHVVKNKKVRHTQTERNIMQKISHPFVMRLHYAFQNKGKLYMVMDYLNGGDLFYHLSLSRRFPEERARFYAAEVMLALECLHEHGFIYRDLKPENVLTDGSGHIRLTDFGLSKDDFTEGSLMTTFVGTTEYLAPEVLRQKGYGKGVDWWSLGVLVFEMLTGCPPFYSKNRQMTFRMILSAELSVPDWLSPNAKQVIKDLLIRDPTQRLGAKGTPEVRQHPYFAALDLVALRNLQLEPPYKPPPLAIDDTSHFDQRFTSRTVEDSPTGSPEEGSNFDNFSYQTPSLRDHRLLNYKPGGAAAGSYSKSAAGSYSKSPARLAGSMSKFGSLSKSVGSKGATLPRIDSGYELQDDRYTGCGMVREESAGAQSALSASGSGSTEAPVAGEAAAAAAGGGEGDVPQEEEEEGDVPQEEEEEEGGGLGQSLVQSALADAAPRWREHDSKGGRDGRRSSSSSSSTDDAAPAVPADAAPADAAPLAPTPPLAVAGGKGKGRGSREGVVAGAGEEEEGAAERLPSGGEDAAGLQFGLE